MKQKLLSITLLLFAVHAVGYAQEAIERNNRMNVAPVVIMKQTDTTKTNDVSIEKTETEKKEIFTTVENSPSSWRNAELIKFLSSNIQYPTAYKKKDIQGKVVVLFVIDTDGSITNIRLIRKINPDLDKEAIRVIKDMPKWTPDMNGGKNVRVRFT